MLSELKRKGTIYTETINLDVESLDTLKIYLLVDTLINILPCSQLLLSICKSGIQNKTIKLSVHNIFLNKP